MRVRPALFAVLGAASAGAVWLRRLDAELTAADEPCAPDELLLPAGQSRTVVTDDGANLAVTVAGEGPTVVLSHCWTGAREIWAPVAHRLVRRGFQVVLYDQRGHGSSTIGTDGLGVERLGEDLRAVLDAVDARDAVLAGHSMGGMTIMALALRHADVLHERARALVLVSTKAERLGDGRNEALNLRIVASPLIERLMRTRYGYLLVRDYVGPQRRLVPMLRTRDSFVACAAPTRHALLGAMHAMDLRDGLPHVKLPTTVVVGGHDELTPRRGAEEIVALVPDAQLEVLPESGHMLPLENPDAIADLIVRAAVAPQVAGQEPAPLS